jgi:two-component sensor histidine kinase
MANLAELAEQRSRLTAAETDHLQRLLGTWGLLADLSFSDLMLFGRDRSAADEHSMVVLGQIRPTTSQTLFTNDWVGRVVTAVERPLVDQAFLTGAFAEGEIPPGAIEGPVRETCIPVTFGGRTIAVLTKDANQHVARQDGVLERTYLDVFNRFAEMVADGGFPFSGEEERGVVMPRVGDGVMVLDAEQRVQFASPNAISGLHRIGVHANSEGERFGELGLPDSPVRAAFALARPTAEEIERGPNVTILLRIVPLVADGEVTGALVLMRDISELRRRDLMLLSKDATIREESVRRIRSIALVHETLSTTIGDDVPFIEIVRPLVRMVEEGLISPDRPIRFTVVGDAGILPADVATPLAVVLTELLQNVVDHAFASGPTDDATVIVELENTGTRLRVTVTDNGTGTAPGFTIDDSKGLGLSIVRTLVTTELGGTIGFSAGEGTSDRPGTAVRISVPVRR